MKFIAKYKKIEVQVPTGYKNLRFGTHFSYRHPIGVVLAVRNDDGEVKFGWSSCEPVDVFKKKRAIEIAINRALKGNDRPIPSSISDVVDSKFLERVENYFKEPVNPPKYFVMEDGKKKLKLRVQEKVIDLVY